MSFTGANPSPKHGAEGRLPGISNYFRGSDRRGWRTSVPHFSRVRYESIYPGIDLVYHGDQRQLEYDSVLAAVANPRQIELHFDGATRLRLTREGDLLIGNQDESLRMRRPVAYQKYEGRLHSVAARYRFLARNRVGFALGPYDRARALVIDPVLVYSTFAGGFLFDFALGVSVDAEGNTYVTGYTSSPDFPTTRGAYDRTCGTGGLCNLSALDAVVMKINPAGDQVLFSTFLGGSDQEYSYGITADAGGVFVAIINTAVTGTASLKYSTFLGGSADDEGRGITADATGDAYVTGYSISTNFPVTAGAFDRGCGTDNACNGRFRDAFLVKLRPAASGEASLLLSTYLGGGGTEVGRAVDLDGAGNIYVTGPTGAFDFPAVNAFQPAHGGGPEDGFIAKFNPQASAPLYSTYIGGAGEDVSHGIAVDAAGNANVAGYTTSTNLPLRNALQSVPGGGEDAFVAKLDPTGALVYSTYLGGSSDDRGFDIAVDRAGAAYAIGYTQSANFPTARPFQGFAGGGDIFVAKIVEGPPLMR